MDFLFSTISGAGLLFLFCFLVRLEAPPSFFLAVAKERKALLFLLLLLFNIIPRISIVHTYTLTTNYKAKGEKSLQYGYCVLYICIRTYMYMPCYS